MDEDDPKAIEAYRKAAKRLHHSDCEVEIDSNAVVSFSSDGGAYVGAWVWVPEEAIKG